MIVEQIVEIPADRRITLDVPRTVKVGKNILTFTPVSISENIEIDDVRRLLQKEMTENGTSAVMTTAGEGWKAHVSEHYAES